ncbi:beta-galactosidase [Candidatus Sumerlaeota bacterium]|nr:beta-galactosidase [Candidatus Sumerlaeota bacterium]
MTISQPAGDANGVLYRFDLNELSKQEDLTKRLSTHAQFEGEALEFNPQNSQEALEFTPGAPWAQAAYFVFDVFIESRQSQILQVNFHHHDYPDESRIYFKLGVLPGVKTRMIVQLDYLDGQTVFMPRYPRQLKGVVFGRRLNASDIGRVTLSIGRWEHAPQHPPLILSNVHLTTETPPPLPDVEQPVVDRFGQWTVADWPGKVKDEADQLQRHKELNAKLAATEQNEEFSRYGGWKKLPFDATGFFRTQHDGKRWWLVDPEGYAFLSAGVDCIGAGNSGPWTGMRDLFEWLPEPEKEDEDAEDENTRHRRRWHRNQVNFTEINLKRVYGEKNWREEWTRLTKGLMRYGCINTVANWSDLRFAREAQIPYVYPMHSFPHTQTAIYRDLPDVFSPEYRENSKQFARQMEELKDDPYLIGYFLRNEPTWGFSDKTLNLALEMMGAPVRSHTKDKFIEWLKEKYNSEQTLSAAWGLQVEAWDRLNEIAIDNPDVVSATANADMMAFSEIMVREYVRVPHEAVRAVDPNHLDMGMRYGWVSSELLYTAGEFFDVFSINGYSLLHPPETGEIARRSGKPVLIGEFHHGSTDRGLPATGIRGVKNQYERGQAYRSYIEHGFARPELIAMHYFQWNDQLVTGRFDGENYNIGVVDVNNLPHTELLDAMRETNQRIYAIATGAEKPIETEVQNGPHIFY